MSLQEQSEKKEKREPTLGGQIKATRRAYLKSILLKKQAIGIVLSDFEKGTLAAFEAIDAEQ